MVYADQKISSLEDVNRSVKLSREEFSVKAFGDANMEDDYEILVWGPWLYTELHLKHGKIKFSSYGLCFNGPALPIKPSWKSELCEDMPPDYFQFGYFLKRPITQEQLHTLPLLGMGHDTPHPELDVGPDNSRVLEWRSDRKYTFNEIKTALAA